MRIFTAIAFAAMPLLLLVSIPAFAQPKTTPHFPPSWAPDIDKKGAPTDFGGFKFGWTVSRVRRACKRAKHRFVSPTKESPRGTCTGMAKDMGFEGQATLSFCGKRKKLCEVTLRFVPLGDPDKVHWSQWAQSYHRLLTGLTNALGKEIQQRVNADEACWTALRERNSARCFARDARAKHHWTIAGFEVALSLARSTRPAHDAPDLICKMRSPIRLLEMSRTSD